MFLLFLHKPYFKCFSAWYMLNKGTIPIWIDLTYNTCFSIAMYSSILVFLSYTDVKLSNVVPDWFLPLPPYILKIIIFFIYIYIGIMLNKVLVALIQLLFSELFEYFDVFLSYNFWGVFTWPPYVMKHSFFLATYYCYMIYPTRQT